MRVGGPAEGATYYVSFKRGITQISTHAQCPFWPAPQKAPSRACSCGARNPGGSP